MKLGVLRETSRMQQVAQLLLVAAALHQDDINLHGAEVERSQHRQLRTLDVDREQSYTRFARTARKLDQHVERRRVHLALHERAAPSARFLLKTPEVGMRLFDATEPRSTRRGVPERDLATLRRRRRVYGKAAWPIRLEELEVSGRGLDADASPAALPFEEVPAVRSYKRGKSLGDRQEEED